MDKVRGQALVAYMRKQAQNMHQYRNNQKDGYEYFYGYRGNFHGWKVISLAKIGINHLNMFLYFWEQCWQN